jgi:membrane fusion protein (multidrug efflux system)
LGTAHLVIGLIFVGLLVFFPPLTVSLAIGQENLPNSPRVSRGDLNVLSANDGTGGDENVLVATGVSRPVYNAQLSFALPGSVFNIAVKPGQAVKEGDLLMSLDLRAEDYRLELLEKEINNTIKLKTLSTRIAQAELDMKRYADALLQKAATEMEAQHAKLTYNLSLLALEEEEFRLEQLGRNYSELLAQRDRMRLYAPNDGFIEDILVERGMAVDKNVPALRLVSIDPVQVDLNMPVEQALQLTDGDEVEVFLPGEEKPRPGTVVHVAKVAVLSNRTLKVRVQAPNPAKAPAGLMVRVRFPQVKGGNAKTSRIDKQIDKLVD